MENVLNLIKPSLEEKKQFKQINQEFCSILDKSLNDAKSIVGGSAAKDTWLKNEHDLDVFVAYNFKKHVNKSDQLSDLLEASLRKSFPKARISRLHGSRDYFRLIFKGIEVEIIPILKIANSSMAQNITDVSTLHSKWVNKHSKKLKDEIRLAKKFFKSNGLYGAESYIGGFSGYVIEILIIKFGSLNKLLKEAINWKVKKVIDIEDYYAKKDALFELNNSKTISPIIVIDPVDKNRNASAALSSEKLSLLKKKAKEFLKDPSEKFFEKESLEFRKLKQESSKNNLYLVYLEVSTLSGKGDVVGAKLLKAFNYLKKNIQRFKIKKSGWEWEEKAIFYFMVKENKLPDYEIRKGPPIKLKDFAADFKKKNKDSFVEKGVLMAKIKNPHPNLQDFVSNHLKQKYFREKVKSVKKII